jgi:chorismate mutase
MALRYHPSSSKKIAGQIQVFDPQREEEMLQNMTIVTNYNKIYGNLTPTLFCHGKNM